MKRTRTLISYFSPAVPEQQGDATGHGEQQPEDNATPSPAPEQQNVQAPTLQSQGIEEELTRTRASAAQAQNVDFVEEGGGSNHVLDPEDIIVDPGCRKPIEEMHPNVRDDAKREYILLGPCQLKGHAYPKRKIYGKNRSFHDTWYTNRAWLEYSVSKDAAFCFYCYLFKPLRVDNFGIESFTTNGFTNWKDGPKLFDDHANSVLHNKARKDYECYKNQRQSVSHVISRGSQKEEEEYRGRLLIILGVVRFLLWQAHAFRGHDESSQSSNKGNFLEMLNWYKQKDAKAARLLASAAKNNTMTSPKVQKDLCKACAELTTKAIVAEIGDRKFAVLVDEARDASIKEQMAVVLRFVDAQGQVIERFLGMKCVADTTSSSLKEALDGFGPSLRQFLGPPLVATVVRRRRDDERSHGEGGTDAFYLELQLLARLNHRHVVRLRGFAQGHHARFLVFDHMENRSLKECLHDPLRTPLDWRTRLQVAIDIAAALEYLYYHCDPPVFHVSVNSGNVLMDANFVAKLSDVGVISHDVKLATTDSFQDQVEQRRAGLVFEYGVLVLELVTGQSPGGGDGELVRWVQDPGFAASVDRMVDADLGGVYDARELRDLVVVARLCTRDRDRDGGGDGVVVTIPQIVRYLQGKLERIGCQDRFG